MIKPENLESAHFQNLKKEYPHIDQLLFEKTIRALVMLERMALSKQPFIFKGGTALMLLLEAPTRLSIDLDIIIEAEKGAVDIKNWLHELLEPGYTLVEDNERATSGIPKAHFKVHYTGAGSGRTEHIIIDVVFHANPYQTIQDTHITLPFLKKEGESITVTTPDLESILADKLVAFSPNTGVGVPFWRKNNETGLLTDTRKEVIKQMHDVSRIVEKLGTNLNLQKLKAAHKQILSKEAAFRGLTLNQNLVLQDGFDSALAMISQGRLGSKENFADMVKGVEGFRNFIFTQPYGQRQQLVDASRVCWLIRALLNLESGATVWPTAIPNPGELGAYSRLRGVLQANTDSLVYWNAIAKMG